MALDHQRFLDEAVDHRAGLSDLLICLPINSTGHHKRLLLSISYWNLSAEFIFIKQLFQNTF
jgi:hypothetical protein